MGKKIGGQRRLPIVLSDLKVTEYIPSDKIYTG